MNAYEKNNAYGQGLTAYDYSEGSNERVSDRVSAYDDGFDRAFYYGATERAPEHEYAEPAEIEAQEELNSDLLPSERTIGIGEDRSMLDDYREEPTENVVRKFKINGKAKIFIAVYAIVIATIFSLIILNTTLLKRLDNAVALKQTEINELKAENDALKATLNYVSDDAVIEGKAAELGMIKR